MKNTLCRDCYFAKKTTSNDKACFFDIPAIVKDIHNIHIDNEFNVIENYQCRYGMSNKIYKENIDKFHSVDLIEYIKQQNTIRYSVAVILDKSPDIDLLINNLNNLSIKPYYITIVCYNNTENLTKKINKLGIKYKIHKFLEDIAGPQALHIALETNKQNIQNVLWILTETGLDHVVKNDSIQEINYLVNVEQKSIHYYKCSNIDSNIDGVFIGTDNYKLFSKTIDYTIEQNTNILFDYYD